MRIKIILQCLIFSIAFIFTCNSLYAQNQFYYAPGKFSFVLPSGWKRIPNDVVDKYLIEMQSNYEVNKPNYNLCFNRKKASWPFEPPYFVITIYKGYQTEKDIENLILKLQKKIGNIKKEEGFKDFIKDLSVKQPVYNRQKNVLTFSTEVTTKDKNGIFSNQTIISSLIFCKYGIVGVNYYSKSEKTTSNIPIIKKILESFKFDEGYEYRKRLPMQK